MRPPPTCSRRCGPSPPPKGCSPRRTLVLSVVLLGASDCARHHSRRQNFVSTNNPQLSVSVPTHRRCVLAIPCVDGPTTTENPVPLFRAEVVGEQRTSERFAPAGRHGPGGQLRANRPRSSATRRSPRRTWPVGSWPTTPRPQSARATTG